MISAGVSWWPGNISSGDVHVHHVVFGMVFMMVAGLLAFAPSGWGCRGGRYSAPCSASAPRSSSTSSR